MEDRRYVKKKITKGKMEKEDKRIWRWNNTFNKGCIC